MKRLTGETGWIQGNYDGNNEGTGAFIGEDRSKTISTDSGTATNHPMGVFTFNTEGIPYSNIDNGIKNAEENRVRNRLIRVWKRTR
jgi:hypothetical protein